jgi:hypothetical protein
MTSAFNHDDLQTAAHIRQFEEKEETSVSQSDGE